MSDERETYEYEAAGGKLYLRIETAERRTYNSYSETDGRLWVEELQPRVYVVTDPEFKGDVSLGFVKVRGRKYTIERMIKRLQHPTTFRRGSEEVTHWTYETASYWGGFRNDRSQRVNYDAKAWGSLTDIEHEVLDRFHEEHPEWVTESIGRLFTYERDSHASKAEALRKEAVAEDRKAAEWGERLSQLGAEV
ncbi:hypothetical protein P1P75_01200 [Streptomyces sp. ID05-39B]|uniref:hypothetical protein n=1 Tax=Streptomyces sp. ID05-39B TaxID=3028664 RepID=UPI0029ABE2CE|nr:hypothetical protein [Streptomyces sp. ID05-39B]MDX3525099.1 hypothetical protein [Streptomyces sp. ID05-39B]